MIPRLQLHLRCSISRLRGQLRSRIARQSHLYACFSQRLNDDVDVSRPRTRQPRNRVHVLLIHDHRAAHSLKNPLRQLHLLVGNIAPPAQRRHARSQRDTKIRMQVLPGRLAAHFLQQA